MTDRAKLVLCYLAVSTLSYAYGYAISHYKPAPICPVYSDKTRW